MSERIQRVLQSCTWIAMLGLLALAGCGQGKASLHEDDHEMPAHWPNSLADAAEKIESHFQELQAHPSQALDGNTVFEQFRDLIEWAPNIAGDDDLSEQDWNPIYYSSEKIRTGLSSSFDAAKLQPSVQELCTLLRQSHEKVIAIQKANAVVDDDLPAAPQPAGPATPESADDSQTIETTQSPSEAESK